MKITDIKTTYVSVPMEAYNRSSWGAHAGKVTRMILQIFTDEGIVGIGEGGTSSAEKATIDGFKSALIGEDPFLLERIRNRVTPRIMSSFARPHRIFAPIEMALLDIQGQGVARPVYELLGGKFRDPIPFAAYLFYRYPKGDRGGEDNPEGIVKEAKELVEKHGFKVLKLKGGVLPPKIEIDSCYALRDEFGPDYEIRLDPNAVWSVETSINAAKALADCRLEYLEDPTWGIAGMSQVREKADVPLCTNMCVIDFDQIPPAFQAKAVDIILADVHIWGGIVNCKHLGVICDTLGFGVGMHSVGHLGISQAATLHACAIMPNMCHAADSHYHHYLDDVIQGGRFEYEDGAMEVPKGPGLGVKLDDDKLNEYAEAFNRDANLRTHGMMRGDSKRPDWIPIKPQW